MNRVLLLIIGFMVSMSVVAQDKKVNFMEYEEEKTPAPLTRLKTSMTVFRPNSDTICVNFKRKKDISEFFTGIFFKRVSENVLKLPSTRLEDRFLSCEDLPIVDYSVEMLSGGRTYLKELRLVVPPKKEKVVLTTTDANGEVLSEIELILSPKMTFYLDINGKKILLDDFLTTRPYFEETDDVSLVAVADNGKMMEVEKHLLFGRQTMGFAFTEGPFLSLFEKQLFLNSSSVTFGFRICFGDDKNNSWYVSIYHLDDLLNK